jgi:hypothetical protein
VGSLEWFFWGSRKGMDYFFCFNASHVPLKYVSLGLAGILKHNEYSSFLKDMKAQIAEADFL